MLKSRIKTLLLVISIAAAGLSITACEDKEADQLNQAQACLDKVTDEAPAEAAKCSNFVNGLDTKQSWIIRCSVDFLVGGLTTTRIMGAFKELDGGTGTDKESHFMGALALSSTATADSAFVSCQKSGVSSLIYIASLSRAGTHISAALGGLLGQIGTDGNDYEVNEAQMQSAVDACQADSADCDKGAIGESVLALEDTYCSGSSKDSEVCGDINKAVANSDGTSEDVADLLFCLMDKPLQPPCDTL